MDIITNSKVFTLLFFFLPTPQRLGESYYIDGSDTMAKKGCVLIHGFTGSPKEIQIVADDLYQHGMDVVTPILPGHGDVDRKKMRTEAKWKEWVLEGERAVENMLKTHEEVYVVGFSMGGMIAIYLAAKYPIKKLVLLSASVYYMNIQRFVGSLRGMTTKDQWSRYLYKIKKTPLVATIQFRRLVKELVRYIELVQVPTLIIQGELDDLVDPKSARYIYNTILSEEKYLHYLPKSRHVICHDVEKDTVVTLVHQFLLGGHWNENSSKKS